MKLIQLIRELLAGLDPAKVQQFIQLLLMIFGGGSSQPRFGASSAAGAAPTPAEKEQLKTELISKGCDPVDADAVVENL